MGSDAASSESRDSLDLTRILDVTVEASAELGRRRMAVAEVLSLAPGSVLDFSKGADEPLDVRVNGRLIARAEAVVIGDRYGIRIVEIVSPAERFKTTRHTEQEKTE